MLSLFTAYTRSFLAFAGKRAGYAAGLLGGAALLEGVGIVVLVPVLMLFSGDEPDGLAGQALSWLSAIGLDNRNSQISAIVALFIVMLALRNIIGWHRDRLLQQLSLGFVDHHRTRIFTAIAYAPWSRASALTRSDMEHAIVNNVSRLSVGTQQLLQGITGVAILTTQLIIAFLLSPALTLTAIAMFAVAGIIFLPLIRRARTQGERTTRTGQATHAVLGHFFSGLKLAKLHDAEPLYMARFEAATADMRAIGVEFMASQALARGVFQFVSGSLAALAALIGLIWLEIPLAILIVLMLVLSRLSGPLLQLMQSTQNFAHMLPAFHSLGEMEAMLQAPEESATGVLPVAAQDAAEAGRSASLPEGPARLDIRNVAFMHPGQTNLTLENASLTIEPGQCVALVGESGSGKTSLLDLACGLTEPRSGLVLGDGVALADQASRRQWRRGLAYVPQDPFLFDMSLIDNLRWTDSSIDEKAIAEALAMAEADQFVAALPQGLNSRMGERGQSLSGGERQRLCLARALLRKPRLLILDEATNALDSALEARILDNLTAMRGAMSLLIVTHREHSLHGADALFRIVDGHVSRER